jgi:hypothetical protein
MKEVVTPLSSSGEKGFGRFGMPVKKDETKKDPSKLLHLTTGEKDVIEAIEKKISKLGYESIIRIIYVAKKDVFDLSIIGSMFGLMKQYNTMHLNSFRPVGAALTRKKEYFFGFYSSANYVNKVKRGLMYAYKHRTLYYDLKKVVPLSAASQIGASISNAMYRIFPSLLETLNSKPIVLNTEEMASLFHFPGETVGSPTMPRMQSKQSEPPIDLPIG